MELKSLTIETLSQESEKILKTLPLAHYLKVDTIPIVFDKTSKTSFFDPSTFQINIALSNIALAIIGSGKTTISEIDLEKHIRCFLYHEISHAILTPRELMKYADNCSKNGEFTLVTPKLANIIEDERIETILKNYYHGVDFKENLHNICKLEHAKTFEDFVFNAVRFRYSPILGEQVNLAVKEFIIKTAMITSTSVGHYASFLLNSMQDLLIVLKNIWDKLCSKAKQAKEQKNQQNQKSSSSQEDESSSTTEEKQEKTSDESSQSEEDESSSTTEEKQEKTSDESSQSEEDEDITSEIEDSFEELDSDSELSDERIEKIFERAVIRIKKSFYAQEKYSLSMNDFKADRDAKTELLKVIVRNCGVGVNQSQAQFGYSGRFNAKRFMKDHNDSCKWFEKRAYEDNQKSKKSSKKILNIWLDQSSSFLSNDAAVNGVLKALYEIEKSRDDFEWNLVRVNTHFVIENNKEKRYSYSRGDNALPINEIEDCYKKLNKTKQEFNLVLFDGKVGKNLSPNPYCSYQNLKVFDNNRTIFITEYSNTNYISKVCKNAKAIIEENSNYALVLANNIVKALDLLF